MATMLASKQGAFMGRSSFAPAKPQGVARRGSLQVTAGLKEVRDRIASVKNTNKITDAMKLVAAAKVRRAQEAVVNGRPFSENLVKVLYGVNQRVRQEDVDSPLCAVRPVKTVMLVVLTGDRGLCGGYNNFIIKKTEQRARELAALGVKVQLVCVGRKGQQYFGRRPQYKVIKNFNLGATPTTKDAQAIADEIFASFISQSVDKVELVFTKFVSLINSNPAIQTLLPMTPMGELCDVDGKCVDAAEDEIFKLTTKGGAFAVEREKATITTEVLDPSLIFEQEPAQILDALLPLYMNSCLLRSLQEALASELAARMNAMNNASDNAKELRKVLTVAYNKQRQAKITQELAEIVGGAAAAGK
ncbi:hypothetical protein HYH03_009092 [Edaphochlamys debaryana]|uniref:F-ATPase gamma subunit n=1 Tax=Edaphochlamys debaryana TaxID=47281 RepID=A0A835XX12_9CHLO|nr:hypothetical protein HYH03_009092 [Edaphochlamys debaryana]|eukprot:KAG2492677.1 hypothetical protein HYH03_009092 [Edaphochlamys debaryana]